MTDRLGEIAQPDPGSGGDPTPPAPSDVSYDAIFLSDLHNGVGGYNGLKQMMQELKNEGVNPRVLSHGGDYVEDGKGGLVEWQSQVYGVIHGTEIETYPAASTVYTMGNHDWETASTGGGQEGPALHMAALLHGRDQQTPDGRRHHDPCRKAGQRLLHRLAQSLAHEEHAARADRRPHEGDQQPQYRLFHLRPNQPFFSQGSERLSMQV